MQRRGLAASVVIACLLAASGCGPDWDALDPSLGDGDGGSGGASTTSTGGSGQVGSGGAGQGGSVDCTPVDDGNDCTSDVCQGGEPVNIVGDPGGFCDDDGGSRCNAAGECVECVTGLDCPDPAGECLVAVCTADACDSGPADAGAACTEDGGAVCDGQGACVECGVASDCGADTDCLLMTCTAGACGTMNVAAGTACDDGGVACDGQGACAGCNVPADCGADTACQTRTCAANVCGVNNLASGLPAPDPTDGDCQKAVCDGNGGTMAAVDDTDLPDDANQCTTDTCAAGVPSNADVASGTACNEGGGIKCDGNGACVECIADLDCGPTTEWWDPLESTCRHASLSIL